MNTPDLTTYRTIHQALRQGARRLADGAPALADAGAARRRAYARYWKGYAGEVLLHHRVEDDVFFPALVSEVPVAASLITRTDADHAHLDALMDRLTVAVGRTADGSPDPSLPVLTRELADHMDGHLGFEDAEVLPLFERHFTAEAYEALDQEALQSIGVGRQAAFTVPFAVAAVAPERRAELLAAAPVPMRVLHRLTRGSHARLVRRAFGDVAGATGAAPSSEVAA